MTGVALVGVPGDRRTTATAAALAARGVDHVVVPWTEVAGAALDPGWWAGVQAVRVDTPGDDPAALRSVLAAGGHPGAARHDPTLVAGTGAWYRGVTATIAAVTAASRSTVPVLPAAGAVALAADKAAAHRALAGAGVAVPAALADAPGSWAELRALLADRGWGRVAVKLRHGSSAAGALALAVGGGRVEAWSPVELARGPHGLVARSSLRLRHLVGEAEVAELVDHLAPEGLHVEHWYPKLGLGPGPVDLRVVVIDGEPGHVVARQGRGPFTNLHLGGGRASVADVRARLAPGTWEAALATAVQAAAVVAEAGGPVLQVGVDVLLAADGRSHAVAEVNAFGDLVPGIVDGLGRSTHEAQADRLAALVGPSSRPAAVGAP